MAVFALTGANAHVNYSNEVANVQAVESSTTYRATYSKDNLNVYDKTSPIIATVNGNSVDFNKSISFSFYTGNVNITGVALNWTDITAGTTGTVVIDGVTYDVVFDYGYLDGDVCELELTVKSTPLGDLSITFY
ncbi:MAG: hypothetical protein ACLTFL_18155 [Bacteroides thetaiotaomicron]|uniref:hypothetical protein n=1 Tax=Alistipes sp. TaxID=1872444 RepID=UPI0039942618